MLIAKRSLFRGAMESGIIGGKEAEPHSLPYMVSLQIYNTHMCGGMLIRKDYVLTAAHCIDLIKQSEMSKLEVVLGAHNLKKKELFQQRIPVQKCIKHPSYKQKEVHHDIMLLKLKNKAKINKFTKVKALPKTNDKLPANQMCSVAGWGFTAPNGPPSNVLREVSLKLQFSIECKYIWQNHFNSQHMICTASDGKRSFCTGDSGSPLICNNQPQGIVAFANGFDCRKGPQVYTKIGFFLPWIKKVIVQRENVLLSVSLLVLSILPLSGAMKSGIVEGHEVKPHSRPYMVSVQLNKEHKCGGMLIREDYVLTAAHCLDGYKTSEKKQKLEVLLGAHNISRKEPSQRRIEVKKYIKHPSYKEGQHNHSYDIMLLKLKNKAKLTKSVQIITLPKNNKNIPANKDCSIAGWGRTEPRGSASDVLKEVRLKLQFNVECKNIWQMYFDSQRMICTASDGEKGFCQGDSGSPLMCNNKLTGLAVFTNPDNCIKRKYPGVYIKVAYFHPWIQKEINPP
uniref:trypsin n=1 Tax=Astyanax mexicanus TaxID=7994 RepID=A0A8B9GQP8_ASTMX